MKWILFTLAIPLVAMIIFSIFMMNTKTVLINASNVEIETKTNEESDIIDITVIKKEHDSRSIISSVPIISTRTVHSYYIVTESERLETTKDIWFLLKEGQEARVYVNAHNQIVNLFED